MQRCSISLKIGSKIKIIAGDLDQKSKRSKITAIDLDQMQDQRSRSLILIFDLFLSKRSSKRSKIKIKFGKMSQYCYYSVKMSIIWLNLLIFDLDLWSFISKKIKDQRSRSWSHSEIIRVVQKIKDQRSSIVI